MENLALQWAPTAALAAVGGYILLLVLTIRMRGLPGVEERWFAGYLILSALWTVAWALANVWGWIQPWIIDLAASATVYLAAMLPVVLAVLIYREFPSASAYIIGILVGIRMIFAGWSMILMGAEGESISDDLKQATG